MCHGEIGRTKENINQGSGKKDIGVKVSKVKSLGVKRKVDGYLRSNQVC